MFVSFAVRVLHSALYLLLAACIVYCCLVCVCAYACACVSCVVCCGLYGGCCVLCLV